jgi:proline racemase
MFEKMKNMAAHSDHIRRLLLCEPRGSVVRHLNVIVPSTRDDCDVGLIVMEPTEYVPMSGSNTIAAVTVMLETGILPMQEPMTVVRLDMPAGAVTATAACRDGRCEHVEFENVASFAHTLDAMLDVPGLGRVKADIAYGGMFFAIVDADELGIALEAANARRLSELGEAIRKAARTQLDIVHPENPDIRGVTIVQFAETFKGPGRETRNNCIVAPGRLDRSPTGTGTSARLAVLHARGEMKVGEEMTHTSVLGSRFHGKILSSTTIGGREAIIPSIRGSAWITGFHTYILDPDDPWPQGYVMSDTWGVSGQIDQ